MKNSKKLHSVALASAALILFLIFVSSTASAASEQNASSAGTYAYITNYEDGTVSVIDTATNTVTATVPVGTYPWGVAVNPTGTKVYVTNGGSGTVSVIDTATNTVTATVNGFSGPIGVAVTPDGTKVYVANAGNDNISVIDATTNTVTSTVNVGLTPFGVAVTPDGSKVYVTKYDGTTVSVIDTATNNVTATVNTGPLRYGVAVTPDGKKVYVANWGSNPAVIDTATNTVTATVPADNYSSGVAVTPDGKNVYMANYYDNIVSVIDTATNTVTATVNVGYQPCGVSVTPDGTKVYVVNYNSNTVSVIDTTTNEVTATVPVGSYPETFGQFICSVPAPAPILPVANFTSNVTEGYAPLIVQFTDLSENSTSRKWTFGDNLTSTLKTPIHQYSRVGNYTVSLTATNAVGNNTITKINYITVTATEPVANFTSNVTSGTVPLTVAFNDSSTGSPTSWKWSLGDGSTSINRNKTHLYSKAGNYNVSLTVNNTAGNNTVMKTGYITVTAIEPVANFTSNVTSGTVPLTVAFNDSSTGSPTSWKWSLGDGSTSINRNKTHLYSKAGNYNVSLTVNNTAGNNTVMKTGYITVTATEPVANFTSNVTSGTVPLTVAFNDSSTGSPTSWKWSLGDGSTSINRNKTHLYSKAGNYNVSLTVNNTAGNNTVMKTGYITVTATEPVANFTSNVTSGTVPLTVAFNDSSTGSPTSWKWSLGDGSTSINRNKTHLYSKAGNYNVSLTVNNTAGNNTVMKTGYITVTATEPVANFTSNVTSGTVPLTVAFNDSSTGSPTSWKWSLGDGSTSINRNKTHLYSKAGNYNVSLTVNNTAGNNTVMKTGYITVKK